MIEFRFQPPSWVTGGLSTADADSLIALVRAVAPESVIEIGVAAGTSSAALLYALDSLPASVPRFLHSVDVRPTCYFDPSRKTGSAVGEMYPEHRTLWVLDTSGTARRVAERRPSSEAFYDLAFIDADHRHPWPLLDVLHLVAVLRPGSWIALHDIALPRLHGGKFRSHGAEWLFGHWLGEKMIGGGSDENLGMVRVPADVRALVPMAVTLLTQYPWEATPVRGDVAWPDSFAPITAAYQRGIR